MTPTATTTAPGTARDRVRRHGPVAELPHPNRQSIAAHLADHHHDTGLGLDVIAAHTPDELIAFHEVDHHYIAPGYLGHTHTAIPTPPATDPTASTGSSSADRRIHDATLKAVREGRPVGNLEEILERARQASVRQMAASTDPQGRRIPGAGRLSQADRDALEIARAVSERAARRARSPRGARRG